jgi:hypothetical protein
MSEHDDYADNDLPPPWPVPAWVRPVATVLVVAALMVLGMGIVLTIVMAVRQGRPL